MERAEAIPAVGVDIASKIIGDIVLLDVRKDDEWASGHAALSSTSRWAM